MNKNRKLANMAMLVALAMIFSYVESLIPINFGIPGMKLGVANLVTVTGMYFLEFPEVFLVVVMRILLTGFLFGNGMSIVYSLAGGILSFLVMALMKRLKGFSVAGVSIAGGVSHNIGQIIVASVVIENLKHAELEKSELEERIQNERNQFDKQLEDHTQKELNDIHKGLNRQMDEILARQNRKNQTAIEELKKDFEEKHTAYAEKIVRRIIEG